MASISLAGGAFVAHAGHGKVRHSSLTWSSLRQPGKLTVIASPMDGIIMTRTLIRRCWPGLLALAWLLSPSGAEAQGSTPIPISTDSVFIYRFNVKIGPSAFARPAGPWYSYFPIDPNLLARPQVAAFPNWPASFPSTATPAQTAPRFAPGITYYQTPQAMPYGNNPGIAPAGYYTPQQAEMGWYPRQ
jgi:hypothetical protein